MSRRPSGAAGPPPGWLADAALPMTALPAGTTLLRIHRRDRPPLFFSPGDQRSPVGSPGEQRSPVGRFDSATGGFGVMYLALAFEGAFAETVLRNPARRVVDLDDVFSRSLAFIEASRVIRLVKMHCDGLQLLGTDNAVTTGPYKPCGLWADALFAHPDSPDGIAYASRHDPEQVCVALFSRPGLPLETVHESMALAHIPAAVAAALRRCGKGLIA